MPNILYKTQVYLVGHMQYSNGRNWRIQIKKELEKMNITVFDPYDKPFINSRIENEEKRAELQKMMIEQQYDEVSAHMKQVRAEDLRLCDISTFIIAHINPSIASWGSAEEIFWSNRLKKPIFLSVEGGKSQTPLWIMGTIPHKYIYNNWEESLDMVRKIDNGEVEIDSDRWRLLRPEFRN